MFEFLVIVFIVIIIISWINPNEWKVSQTTYNYPTLQEHPLSDYSSCIDKQMNVF